MPYNALKIPPSADGKDGVEVLRAAIVEGGLHVTLRRAFDDPTGWGVLLADVARQVANVYGQQGDNKSDVETKIREAFISALETPTTESTIGPVE